MKLLKSPLCICLIFLLQLVSCSKAPETNQEAEQRGKPVQPKPFKGQVYRAIDDRLVITLVSPDELELQTNGANLICKYTIQDDSLRVVANIMGAAQALYYRITNEGLLGNDGSVLYTPSRLEEVRRAADAARHKVQLNAALGEACRVADVTAAKTLLDQGADINALLERGLTPLVLAVSGKDRYDRRPYHKTGDQIVETVKFLLGKGADVNMSTESGYTPLCGAVKNQYTNDEEDFTVNVALVKILLDAGADPNKHGRDVDAPIISVAWDCSSPEILRELISKGADVNVPDSAPRRATAIKHCIENYEAWEGHNKEKARRNAKEMIAILRKAGARAENKKDEEFSPEYKQGSLYAKNGQYEKAIAEWLKALESDKDNIKIYYNLGIAYTKVGKLDNAIAIWQKALTINPLLVNLHYSIGLAYKEKGNIELAEASLKKTIEIDPNYPNAKNVLEELASTKHSISE